MKLLILLLLCISCVDTPKDVRSNRREPYKPKEICINGVVYYFSGVHSLSPKFLPSGTIEICYEY